LPGPVEAFQFVVFLQAGRPEFLEYARGDPCLEPVMGRAAGTDAGGVQGVPLAARPQDKEDGVHARSVIGTRPTAAEAMRVLMFGQQEHNLLPQFIGNTISVLTHL
jgi:hypothetical protein